MAELLALSKFKLQLLALIAEVRDTRERERHAREELRLFIQRLDKMEAEYAKKLQILREQIASHEESQRRLESKIQYLETEKDLLDKKERELKETINSLLQSRENFLNHFEDSSYQLKLNIQSRDRKLAILTEKIDTQIQLFDSIEKEASAIMQVVNTVEDTINGREQEVTRLKRKVDQISTLEKDFVDRILHLEKKLSNYEIELQKRDASMIELKGKLEAEELRRNFQPQIEERTLMVKDEFIQRLTTEKQILHLQLVNMEVMLRKIKEVVPSLNSEDQKLPLRGSEEISEMNRADRNTNSNSPKRDCSPQAATSYIPLVDSLDKSNADDGIDAPFIHHADTVDSVTEAADG